MMSNMRTESYAIAQDRMNHAKKTKPRHMAGFDAAYAASLLIRSPLAIGSAIPMNLRR